MTYTFTFDASACTGCKACQIACKDKHNLPVGVLWRRVYEVSGGTWQQHGEAWATDVFAYNLSIACNHCVHPKCAGVCPTDAYVQREDGIVYIDESRCMGCGYCAWACPYSAPRYNPELHHMTKCNFCYDNIDAGLPPACVAACPMRVLNIATVDHGQWTVTGQPFMVYYSLWDTLAENHPFPLPANSRTEPYLAIQPHRGMENKLEKSITNWEEIKTGKARNELPLVAFTLLTQMAAGMAFLALFSGPLSVPGSIALGGLIGVGGLVSILHLGTPWNAWRAMFHIKKSWLSREILMFGLFGMSWVLALVFPGMGKLPLALSGLGLVYCMAQVYRLRSIPAWDTSRTPAAFMVSTLLLGGAALEAINRFGKAAPTMFLLLVQGGALLAALGLSLFEHRKDHFTARKFRLRLIGLGLAGVLTIYLVPGGAGEWLAVPIFLVSLLEEVIGRWLFYEEIRQRAL